MDPNQNFPYTVKRDFQHSYYGHDYQGKTIQEYLSCRDVFVSAPTGAGKSVTFELALYAFDCLLGEDCNAIIFVILPLISLMKDLVSSLTFRGIRTSYTVCRRQHI